MMKIINNISPEEKFWYHNFNEVKEATITGAENDPRTMMQKFKLSTGDELFSNSPVWDNEKEAKQNLVTFFMNQLNNARLNLYRANKEISYYEEKLLKL